EQGLVGVDFWIPKQNRGALDAVQALTTNGAVGHVNVAFYDEFGNVKYTVPFAIFVRRVAADTSGANGSKQDWITTVEVSVDSSFATAPISGTNDESAIFAYKQLAA
ncbi:MAG: hypothetical protein GY928_23665, partial [Colwellia sp.]|nr:hypothetical protein [Colwellia sp.]